MAYWDSFGYDLSYWDSFGYEWSRWGRTQLDGPGRDESERTFREKTGLTPEDVRGKRVLDVGCGAGRFLEVVSRWGAKWAVGVEPSEAVRVAYDNLSELDRIRFTPQATTGNVGLYRMTLATFAGSQPEGEFDIVYCIGVLHHTPDPAASFRAVARLVKPGGLLCVWVYGKMGPWSKVSDRYRKITVHLPWPLLRALCLLAVPWDYLRRIPGIGKYLWALVPCSMHPNWRWRWLDTFDWYSPRYQSKHTVEEVTGWFARAGFTDIRARDVPISVRGRRP